VDPRSVLAEAGYGRTLDGGTEYQFFYPIRAGDTLVASSVIKDIVERKGQAGNLVFVFTETTYMNQNGDTVARSYQKVICR